MGKYLVLWELDTTKIPIDPKERGAGWKALMGAVKKDIQEGMTKDWGAFVGETNGYAIHEGTEVEIAVLLQQYVPFVRFKVHPIASVGQVDQLVEALLK